MNINNVILGTKIRNTFLFSKQFLFQVNVLYSIDYKGVGWCDKCFFVNSEIVDVIR